MQRSTTNAANKNVRAMLKTDKHFQQVTLF